MHQAPDPCCLPPPSPPQADKPGCEGARAGAAEVCAALLERVMALQDQDRHHDHANSTEGAGAAAAVGAEQGSGGQAVASSPQAGSAGARQDVELLQALLALHALCCADVELCMGQPDPARFVRRLSPYLKVRGGGGAGLLGMQGRARCWWPSLCGEGGGRQHNRARAVPVLSYLQAPLGVPVPPMIPVP